MLVLLVSVVVMGLWDYGNGKYEKGGWDEECIA